MSGDDAAPSAVTAPFDWYVETSRTVLERTLSAQQTVLDGWGSALAPWPEERAPRATTVRELVWLYDVWSETLQNALVHLDDAVTGAGVDLDALQLLWLHALDDAITDVGRRPAFGATMADAVEAALTVQYRGDERRRRLLGAAGVPTDRDVEAVGKRLLDLEYRQKSVEDKLDAVLDAVGGAGRGRSPETAPAGDAE